MGKLIISTHITVDGVIGPSPGDWAILEGEGERYKFDQLLAADAFLLGRKVYEGLASVWPNITDDTGFAERVNNIPKYVASRTLEEPLEWNASLIKGDLAESVASLKRQHRGNLISFGCGELAYELANRGLADEIHFWVNPAVWGSGDRAFHGRQVRMQLTAQLLDRTHHAFTVAVVDRGADVAQPVGQNPLHHRVVRVRQRPVPAGRVLSHGHCPGFAGTRSWPAPGVA